MALSKTQKNDVVAEVSDLLSSSKMTVVAKYQGTTVKALQQLRRDARANGTKVKVVKNKVAPPFKVVEFDIMYGEGISKIGEIIDLGVELEVIQKSGSWFAYNGNKLGQGRDAVKQLIEDNPELMEELEGKIKDKIAGPEGKAVLVEEKD